MKQLIGAACRITISINDTLLHYTAERITDVSETHITFIDKFGETVVCRISDVRQVQNVRFKGVE